MPKDLYYSRLLDFYGELLNNRQKEIMNSYYNSDLSLAEIAYNLKISRQGVRDIIKRAELQLSKTELKLHLAEQFGVLAKGLNSIITAANEIENQPNTGQPITNLAKNIKLTAQKIYKENIL